MRCGYLAPFVAALMLLLTAAPSSSAQRYAAPAGTGSAASCLQSNPCTLQDAVEAPSVNDGDEVILLAGFYSETNEVTIDDAITVHGFSGPFAPAISTTAPSGIVADHPGAQLRDLAINQTAGSTALDLRRGTAERLRVFSTQSVACAIASANVVTLLRDSTCLSSGASGMGVGGVATAIGGSHTARLRNVTAYATGVGSTGIGASSSGGAELLVDARNVIAGGALADVHAGATAPSTTTISLASSNYLTTTETSPSASITDPGTGGNQTAEPLLVSPAGNDFTQLPGSPTIDAGTAAADLGSFDLFGDPRIRGPVPDIGADEAPDGVAPQTTITAGPNGPTRKGKPSFSFSSSEPGSTFACQVDSDPFQPCVSPTTTDSLQQGPHRFRVRATDPAGNVDATPAERSFDIDKTVRGANVKAKRSQKQGRRVALKISVAAAEAVRVTARGSIDVGKEKLPVKQLEIALGSGQRRTLTLKLKRKSSDRKALKSLRQGNKPEATLSATFVDELGNRATSGVVLIKLKKK